MNRGLELQKTFNKKKNTLRALGLKMRRLQEQYTLDQKENREN
jgi:hypothetical protein